MRGPPSSAARKQAPGGESEVGEGSGMGGRKKGKGSTYVRKEGKVTVQFEDEVDSNSAGLQQTNRVLRLADGGGGGRGEGIGIKKGKAIRQKSSRKRKIETVI